MNTLVFSVVGNKLTLSEDAVSTQGSVNFDMCEFTFDSEWSGFSKYAVFGLGKDTYRVRISQEGKCFIPSSCLENEGIITVAAYGTKNDTVIATNGISHYISEGIANLDGWIEEDYSLVVDAIKHMESKVGGFITRLNDCYDGIIKNIRQSSEPTVVNSVSDEPGDWYLPTSFTQADNFRALAQSESIDDYYDACFDDLIDPDSNYVRREKIGTDASGENDIYAYILEPSDYEKTVLITASVHGTEEMASFALSVFLKEICTNGENDRTLAYIKNRVKLIVIPFVNPYGVINGTTSNQNDVDIAYNFPYNWSSCTKSKKGTMSANQVETNNIIDYVETICSDKLCAAVDFHVDPFTISGKSIFYPRFKDNCLSAISDFVNRYNCDAASTPENKCILASSINPGPVNYFADEYGINGCEVIWPDELYGGIYSNNNYTHFTEFIGNLIFTLAKNSNITCKCGGQPFVKYLTWKGTQGFSIPDSEDMTIMGISNYVFNLSNPCVLTLQGYVVLEITEACTVKINPMLYQINSPEQSDEDRASNNSVFIHELSLGVGTHVIPVSTVLQAYRPSYNDSNRTRYCEDVKFSLAFSASEDDAAQVKAYSLTVSGIPSDLGKPVEISSPIGLPSDYDEDEIPTQNLVYPTGTYTFADGRFLY